jgi:hypothetical protein
MNCSPTIKADSPLGRMLKITKDTKFDSYEEIQDLITKRKESSPVNTPISNNIPVAKKSNKTNFQGYKGGFENTGKGTPEGDGKDKAMREVAQGAIVELSKITPNSSLTSLKTYPSLNEKGKTKWSVTNEAISPNIIMLARNGNLSGTLLSEDTKNVIDSFDKEGTEFVVGDMPNVDSQFIDYLQEIGAKFTIYHTGNKSRIEVLNKTFPSEMEIADISKESIEQQRKKEIADFVTNNVITLNKVYNIDESIYYHFEDNKDTFYTRDTNNENILDFTGDSFSIIDNITHIGNPISEQEFKIKLKEAISKEIKNSNNYHRLSEEEFKELSYGKSTSLFPDLQVLHNNSARLKGFNISSNKASINFLQKILNIANEYPDEIAFDGLEKIKELVDKGIDAIYKGKYGEATSYGEQALSKLHDVFSRIVIEQVIEDSLENSYNNLTEQELKQIDEINDKYDKQLESIDSNNKINFQSETIQAESEEVLKSFANDLSKRTGIEFELISVEEASNISNEYNGEPAFFIPRQSVEQLVNNGSIIYTDEEGNICK